MYIIIVTSQKAVLDSVTLLYEYCLYLFFPKYTYLFGILVFTKTYYILLLYKTCNE